MAKQKNEAQSSQRPGRYVTASMPIGELQGKGKKRKPGPHAGAPCIAFKDGKDCGTIIAHSNRGDVQFCRPCQRRLRTVALDRGWDMNDLAAVSERLRQQAGLKRESAA